MRLFYSKVITIATGIVLLTISTFVSAQELNVNGFSGYINTTVSSGITIRSEDNNCKLLPGYNVASDATTMSAGAAGLLATNKAISQAALKTGVQALLTTISSKNGAGCASSETDGYGNLSYNPLRMGNQNADDGKMNFPNRGDVIAATQKVFTEISGNTDSGIGVNLSFIGSYNPVLDINAADFRKLTNAAEDELESDLTLLDAYINTSVADGAVDVSIGRLATSYGEATFLPIGMNGLVTAGLDLSKLRAPGASIRDAIIPTEQVVAMFQVGEWGVESYYQFGHDPIKLDPKGAFYGSDVAGTGAKNLLASGGYYEGDVSGDGACSYAYNVLELANSSNGADLAALNSQCNAASLAKHTDTATRELYSTLNLARIAQIGADATTWAGYATVGRTASYRSAVQSGGNNNALPGYDSTGLLVGKTTASANTAGLVNVYTDANLAATDFNTGATVALEFANEKYKEPEDAHDFGLSAHRYFDNIGDGVDVGVYFSNYTSKVPYGQVIGKGGVLAGDHVGMYKTAFADYAGADGSGTGHTSGFDVIGKTRVTAAGLTGVAGSKGAAWLALANGAYGSGVGGGFTALSATFDGARKDGGNNTIAANSTTNYVAKNYIVQGLFGNAIAQANGRTKIFHDPKGLVTGAATLYPANATTGMNAATDLAFLSYGATLLPAITPLNLAQVQFVYPEDNQIFAVSFNTNINGTTLQGEVALRPDFKLGTSLGDQINQISDASGSSLALTLFAIESGQTTMHDSVLFQSLEGTVNTVLGDANAMDNLVKGIQRSSLKDISDLAIASDQTDYRTTAWLEHDTLSLDLGTTTFFTASNPITQGLGADSAVLLTELGAVYINDMDNKKNGFIARNGFNEGAGEYLCLGIFQDLTDTQRASISSGMQDLGYENWNIDYNLMEVTSYAKRTLLATTHTRSGVALPAGATLQVGDVVLAVPGKSAAVTLDNNEGATYYKKVTNASSSTNIGAGIVDAIFGNGNYCESQMGADELSATYRVIGSATYNNFNNTNWSMQPNFAWAHDFYGYGPSSLGGFVPGKQSLSLGLNFSKGSSISAGINYVAQFGDPDINTGTDRGYYSANVSYSF